MTFENPSQRPDNFDRWNLTGNHKFYFVLFCFFRNCFNLIVLLTLHIAVVEIGHVEQTPSGFGYCVLKKKTNSTPT